MEEPTIETLWELQKGDMFVEVVNGANGIYFAIRKNGTGVCLSLEEASYLRTLILRALEAGEK
jgi:hypothetical protein